MMQKGPLLRIFFIFFLRKPGNAGSNWKEKVFVDYAFSESIFLSRDPFSTEALTQEIR